MSFIENAMILMGNWRGTFILLKMFNQQGRIVKIGTKFKVTSAVEQLTQKAWHCYWFGSIFILIDFLKVNLKLS